MKPETPTKAELELTIRGLEGQVDRLQAELRIANQAGDRVLGMANRLKDERDSARAQLKKSGWATEWAWPADGSKCTCRYRPLHADREATEDEQLGEWRDRATDPWCPEHGLDDVVTGKERREALE